MLRSVLWMGLIVISMATTAQAEDTATATNQPATTVDEAAVTAADGVCVRNSDSRELLFAVEVEGAERRVEMLAPGEVLCTRTDRAVQIGTVSVYEHADAIEGCSRLVPLGQIEQMFRYVDFDRCFWSSNS